MHDNKDSKEDMVLKDYFKAEKGKIVVPPFPGASFAAKKYKKNNNLREIFCALALSAAAALFVFGVPSTGDLSRSVVRVFQYYEVDRKIPEFIHQARNAFQYNYFSQGDFQ